MLNTDTRTVDVRSDFDGREMDDDEKRCVSAETVPERVEGEEGGGRCEGPLLFLFIRSPCGEGLAGERSSSEA